MKERTFNNVEDAIKFSQTYNRSAEVVGLHADEVLHATKEYWGDMIDWRLVDDYLEIWGWTETTQDYENEFRIIVKDKQS